MVFAGPVTTTTLVYAELSYRPAGRKCCTGPVVGDCCSCSLIGCLLVVVSLLLCSLERRIISQVYEEKRLVLFLIRGIYLPLDRSLRLRAWRCCHSQKPMSSKTIADNTSQLSDPQRAATCSYDRPNSIPRSVQMVIHINEPAAVAVKKLRKGIRAEPAG